MDSYLAACSLGVKLRRKWGMGRWYWQHRDTTKWEDLVGEWGEEFDIWFLKKAFKYYYVENLCSRPVRLLGKASGCVRCRYINNCWPKCVFEVQTQLVPFAIQWSLATAMHLHTVGAHGCVLAGRGDVVEAGPFGETLPFTGTLVYSPITVRVLCWWQPFWWPVWPLLKALNCSFFPFN